MFDFNTKQLKRYLSIGCVYKKDMIVYFEQDICDRIGVVLSGKLKLVHYTYDGEERVLAELEEGSIFGDFLIHSSHPFYPGDLIALEASKISFIDKENLNRLLEKQPLFRHYYLSQLSEKALRFNLHNKTLMQDSLRDKINMWLSYQEKKDGCVKISSKQNLANELNVARPSLSRELALMKRDGLIDYDRHFIYIK
jgi:CRP-like cAMP-binding protein